MKTTIKNNTLFIEIPLSEPRPSGSGKTLLVATTGGAVKTSEQINGKALTVSLNAYFKP